MVMLPGSVVWVPVLSVTATVKVNVPAVVGVPEIPAGGRAIRARPGGSCPAGIDRKSTRLNSSHPSISYAVFCLKKKKKYYCQPGRRKIQKERPRRLSGSRAY